MRIYLNFYVDPTSEDWIAAVGFALDDRRRPGGACSSACEPAAWVRRRLLAVTEAERRGVCCKSRAEWDLRRLRVGGIA